jgi:DNA-binding NarL/FixJ family response regulator
MAESPMISSMDRLTLLIFAQNGPVLESLAAFLEIANEADIVGRVDTVSDLQRALAMGLPDLIIWGVCGANSEVAGAVKQIKTGWPQVRCLVLAESGEQRCAALAGGADEALLWGVSTDQLAATVRALTAARQP